MHELRIIFKGNVQGVGFRYTAHSIAKKYAVSGWVRNLPDGSVELLAKGTKPEINMFIKDVKDYFTYDIDETQENWSKTQSSDIGFHIVF